MSSIQLTDKQKEDCQKVMDHMMQYFWHKVRTKMEAGASFEDALEELKREILNE